MFSTHLLHEKMKVSKKELKNSEVRHAYIAGITSIWFGASITDYESTRKTFDLEPHAAMCLLIMVTESVACGTDIQRYFHPAFGGAFDRTEGRILSETGLYSLQSNGYVRLDAKGKRELEQHRKENGQYYGLGDVQWLLTAKATKLIAAAYCACKGLPSNAQEQARKDMIAANKAAIAKARMQSKA